MARDFNSVAECYTSDELRQLILSLEAPPAFRRRYDELEDHEPRRVLRERAFHANRAMPDRCKGAFDRVRQAQMRPVLGGEIEERQQRVAIVEQAIDGFVVFGHVFLGEAKIVIAASAAARSRKAIFARTRCAWAESTSAACRGRSGSCARLSEGGYGDKRDGDLWRRSRLRQCKYLNNIVEQDHRRISAWSDLGLASAVSGHGAEDVGGF